MSGQRPVCIVGMHRSGTSLVAAMLQGLGVDFGPAETMLPAGLGDNPEGYLEQTPLRKLNDMVLEAAGGTVFDPPDLPSGWQRAGALDGLREQARAALRSLFDGRGRWGWEDPRTSLTLPFWLELTGPMDYVVCVRNPVAVANSLEHRYARGAGRLRALSSRTYRRRNWYELWLRYTRDALRATEGGRRTIVVYEHCHSDPEGVVERLRAFVGSPAPSGEDPLLALVRADLRRSRDSPTRRDRGGAQREARAEYLRLASPPRVR